MNDQTSRSICKFVECCALENGCTAFAHPAKDCAIARLGFVNKSEVFVNAHAFEAMGEIYKCVYENIVEKNLVK